MITLCGQNVHTKRLSRVSHRPKGKRARTKGYMHNALRGAFYKVPSVALLAILQFVSEWYFGMTVLLSFLIVFIYVFLFSDTPTHFYFHIL